MQDLRSKIIQKVAMGLKKLGTVNIAIRYDVSDAPIYDGETGLWTNGVTSSSSFDVIFSEFDATRVFSTSILNDEEPFKEVDKIVIFSSTLMSDTPKINDVIYDEESTISWRVLGVGSDPASAHYELHVRPFKNV